MPRRIQQYATDAIEVTFEPALCIHSARCLNGLPEVFDVRERRWIAPENASPDAVAETVTWCPSGALKFTRLDGGPAEEPDERATAVPRPDGPIFVRGNIDIQDAEGNTIRHVTRAALCRCGGSNNKPFCDNTHRTNGFHAS
jgi:uncharacterized Fe-S cluster protein YjdI